MGHPAVFVLVTDDVVAALLETLLIAGSEKRVQQDVIGFQRGVGFEFAAPVAFIVLLGKQAAACAIDGSRYPAG